MDAGAEPKQAETSLTIGDVPMLLQLIRTLGEPAANGTGGGTSDPITAAAAEKARRFSARRASSVG
eukprot:6260779-Prymnesium_polylepis.1